MSQHPGSMEEIRPFRVLRGGGEGRLDHLSITIVILLLAAGSISVYSASMAHAVTAGSLSHYLMRHVVRIGIGLCFMLGLASIDFSVWRRLAWPLGILGAVLLVATLTQAPINGARRWIRIAGIPFQPVDISKFGFIVLAAAALARVQDWRKDKGRLVPVFLVYLVLMVVLMLQPNKSMMIGITGTLLLMLFAAGLPWSWILGGFSIAAAGFTSLLLYVSNSQNRIADWLQSLQNPMAGSAQQVQALIAFGRGGILGQGPGNSMQKLYYVAEPFNDFIFAIFGEEWGFAGCTLIILLYMTLFLRGLQIVKRSQDPFARMLAMGITGILFMHAVINIYVATGLFPVTGQPLPLFSYGGTSMITMLAAIGILLNISYQARNLEPGKRTR